MNSPDESPRPIVEPVVREIDEVPDNCARKRKNQDASMAEVHSTKVARFAEGPEGNNGVSALIVTTVP